MTTDTAVAVASPIGVARQALRPASWAPLPCGERPDPVHRPHGSGPDSTPAGEETR